MVRRTCHTSTSRSPTAAEWPVRKLKSSGGEGFLCTRWFVTDLLRCGRSDLAESTTTSWRVPTPRSAVGCLCRTAKLPSPRTSGNGFDASPSARLLEQDARAAHFLTAESAEEVRHEAVHQ